jgi:hypothetical protein
MSLLQVYIDKVACECAFRHVIHSNVFKVIKIKENLLEENLTNNLIELNKNFATEAFVLFYFLFDIYQFIFSVLSFCFKPTPHTLTA